MSPPLNTHYCMWLWNVRRCDRPKVASSCMQHTWVRIKFQTLSLYLSYIVSTILKIFSLYFLLAKKILQNNATITKNSLFWFFNNISFILWFLWFLNSIYFWTVRSKNNWLANGLLSSSWLGGWPHQFTLE